MRTLAQRPNVVFELVSHPRAPRHPPAMEPIRPKPVRAEPRFWPRQQKVIKAIIFTPPLLIAFVIRTLRCA